MNIIKTADRIHHKPKPTHTDRHIITNFSGCTPEFQERMEKCRKERLASVRLNSMVE